MTPAIEPTRKAHRVLWHVGALAVFTLSAFLTMRAWLDPELLPGGDFPGFAAEVEWTRARLDRDGTLPAWVPERFGGSTRFMSNLKEIVTYPLAKWLGAVQGTKVMFLLMRIAAAFGMYVICTRCLGSPLAGLPAGYAYGFGAPANLQTALGGHLDLAISCALFPPILLAATSLLRRRRGRDAVLLGTLAALEFCAHSYLQALIVPVIFLLLVVLRPWRTHATAEDPRVESGIARRWLALTAAALAVFLLLGASQATWLAADLSNHTLHSPETVARGLETYVEHTPFLYVNRNDWLAGWLREHAPPGLELTPNLPLFDQQRYLGVVALALCVVGWVFARSDLMLRRWFQTFLLLFAFQYWMSIGPRTLVWQMARSFHWPTTTDDPIRALLGLGSAVCLGWCVVLARRHCRDPAAVPFARVELALGLALVQLGVSQSVFGFFSATIPVLRGMRSPGHFFDLAPFALYAMLGVAITAVLRRVAPRARPALAVAIVLALVADFLPTRAAFRFRRDAEALEATRQGVVALPGEDGTLRIAMLPTSAPPGASLVTAVAPPGIAWTWLSWQAGRYWKPYLAVATAWLSPDLDAGSRPLARRMGDALMRSGRLMYLLDEHWGVPPLQVGPPWTRLMDRNPFALWYGPPVLPMGTLFGSFALLVGGTEWDQGESIADAFEHGVVTVAGGDRLGDNSEDTVAAAGAIRAVGTSLDEPASRVLATRHEAKLLTPQDPTAVARWRTFLAGQPTRPPSAARYARPAPDRMVFDLEVASPAILFVSEAYHPWWRARVDGAVADVLRAQIAFMAVRLPAGTQRVELELRPPEIVVAADRITESAWLALGLAALVSVALAVRRRAGWR